MGQLQPWDTEDSGHCQGLEEARRILPQGLQRERAPCKTLISDFWPPDCARVFFFILSCPVVLY